MTRSRYHTPFLVLPRLDDRDGVSRPGEYAPVRVDNLGAYEGCVAAAFEDVRSEGHHRLQTFRHRCQVRRPDGRDNNAREQHHGPHGLCGVMYRQREGRFSSSSSSLRARLYTRMLFISMSASELSMVISWKGLLVTTSEASFRTGQTVTYTNEDDEQVTREMSRRHHRACSS